MRLFSGILGPERLVLAPQIRGFQDRIVHSHAHDVVTAGQGLSCGHEQAIDLLVWPGGVAIDMAWGYSTMIAVNLLGLDRHGILASGRRSLAKDLLREHGLRCARDLLQVSSQPFVRSRTRWKGVKAEHAGLTSRINDVLARGSDGGAMIPTSIKRAIRRTIIIRSCPARRLRKGSGDRTSWE